MRAWIVPPAACMSFTTYDSKSITSPILQAHLAQRSFLRERSDPDLIPRSDPSAHDQQRHQRRVGDLRRTALAKHPREKAFWLTLEHEHITTRWRT